MRTQCVPCPTFSPPREARASSYAGIIRTGDEASTTASPDHSFPKLLARRVVYSAPNHFLNFCLLCVFLPFSLELQVETWRSHAHTIVHHVLCCRIMLKVKPCCYFLLFCVHTFWTIVQNRISTNNMLVKV